MVVPLAPEHATASDPVAVDSNRYTVEFENDKVRVLRVRFGPHEKSPMHSHPPLVGVFLTPHNSRHTLPDGGVLDMQAAVGEVRYLDAIEHSPQNLSDEPFELIAVELKS